MIFRSNKAVSLLITVSFFMAFASGCGKKTVSLKEETSIETSSDVSVGESENKSTSSEETNILISEEPEKEPEVKEADYSSVLNGIYDCLYDFDFFYADFQEDYYGISEYAYSRLRECSTLKGIGYSIKDLNDDDIDELLIVGDSDADGFGTEIIAVYGYADGKPVLIKEGYSRDALYLLPDNVILEVGSLGAMSSICGEYRIKKDSAELKVVDYHFSYVEESGREVVCQNETGELDPEKSYNVEKSITEYYQDIEEKENQAVTITLNSLADYEYSGSNIYTVKEAANVAIEEYKQNGPYTPGYIDPDAEENRKFATKILIKTDAPISNFTVWKVSVDGTESGELSYQFDEVGFMGFEVWEEPKIVEPGEDLIAVLLFKGDFPEYAFSYRDTNGEFKRFLVFESGMDGSLCMEYVE